MKIKRGEGEGKNGRKKQKGFGINNQLVSFMIDKREKRE